MKWNPHGAAFVAGLWAIALGVGGGAAQAPNEETATPSIGTPPRISAADTSTARSAGDPCEPCQLPYVLPTVPDVRDPVFAILLGLIEEDGCGTISAEDLYREVRRSDRDTNIPIRHLREVRRTPLEGHPRAEVVLVSKQDISLPVPYRILMYRPGQVRTTRVLVLDEWELGTVSLTGSTRADGSRMRVVLEDVRVWGIRKGKVELDVDGWLDKLMGSKLDDTRMIGFALFRYGGQLLGMAVGYNDDGKGRSGTFSFRSDKILFPNPPPLKLVGAHLRGRLERLMPAAAARRRG